MPSGLAALEETRCLFPTISSLPLCQSGGRRPGDAAISVADPSQAAQRLGWRTQRGLEDICRDGWAWQQQNPGGYE